MKDKQSTTKTSFIKPEFISISEAATLLLVSKVTIHSWINKELFKAYKIGRRTLIEKSELLQAIERRQVA
jgi:excisionase family DNA binding protein